MSRTFVHAPAWVKERDPRWRNHFQTVHDHDDGICDLAAYLAHDGYRVRGRMCHVALCWRGRQIHCGCAMCTGAWTRRWGRRRSRQQARLALARGDWESVWLAELKLTYRY